MLNKITTLKNQLLSHQGFVKYASNVSWLMAEKVLRLFLGLFVAIWVTRYLGAEQYGLLSYAQSIVVFFVSFASFGLDGILVRELVQNSEQVELLLGTAFVLKLLAGILALVAFCIFWLIQGDASGVNLLIFLMAISVLFQSFNVIDAFYQSQVMSKYVAWSNAIMIITTSLVKVVLILNQAPLKYFAFAFALDMIVLAFGLIYFYCFHTKKSIFWWCFDYKKAIELARQSIPIIVSGLMFVAYSRIDQIMITHFLGYREVGYFSASLRLIESFYFIPILLVNSFFPAILKAKEHSKELYILRMQRLVLLCLLPCFVICLVSSVGAYFWIDVLYGQGFSPSAIILQLQTWSLLLTAIGYVNSMWFVGEKLEWLLAVNYVVAMLSNVVLNYLLIPKYGLMGAVCASLISQMVAYYGLLWFNSKSRFLVQYVYNASIVKSLKQKNLPL